MVLASILAASSTSTGGLIAATSPAYNLRASSAAASVEVPVRVEATVAVVTVRRAVPVRGPAAISSATTSLPTSALPAELACPSVYDRVKRTAVTA